MKKRKRKAGSAEEEEDFNGTEDLVKELELSDDEDDDEDDNATRVIKKVKMKKSLTPLRSSDKRNKKGRKP